MSQSKNFFVVYLVFFFVFISDACPQNLQSLQDSLLFSFIKKDFNKVYGISNELKFLFPKEVEYQYYMGRSLLELNRNLDEAEMSLNFCATANYKDSWYYLGECRSKIYNFSESVESFTNFIKSNKKSVLKKYPVYEQIDFAKNATILTNSYIKVTIKGFYEDLKLEEFNKYIVPAQIINDPSHLKDIFGYEDNTDVVMIANYDQNSKNILFYSGYGKSNKKGKQIYYVRKNEEDNWSKPKPLPASINTKKNEQYAFFETTTQTLYFSSNCKSSIGGYDILFSRYNSMNNSWSVPENIGFPINSPFDEILFIPVPSANRAYLVTNRQSEREKYNIFLLHYPIDIRNKISVAKKNEKPRLIASFIDKLPNESANTSQKTISSELSEVNIPEDITSSDVLEDQAADASEPDFNVMNNAFDTQFKTDSLIRLAKQKRAELKTVNDQEKRNTLFKEISSLEKEAMRLNTQSIKYFTQIEQDKKNDESKKQYDERIIQPYDTINEIVLFRYTDDYVNKMNNGIKSSESANKDFTDMKSDKGSSYDGNSSVSELIISDNELIYSIQIGAFSKLQEFSKFNDLSPLFFQQQKPKEIYKYFYGLFKSLKIAEQELIKVRNKGFPDAFIVAFYNKMSISTSEAAKIEYSK